jgi:hypothetical protein
LKIVSATLRARATEDGLMEFQDDVPLGKVYQVDADTIEEVRMYNAEKGVEHTKVIIRESPSGNWLPLELLSLGNEQ